ncbi:hypothetical protein [Bacteroides acidifaciens]|uniref:hypothetical protein n=1 Tax=Bacteroides acidifaciens TaxID=85831 RepID=UPI0023BC02ED|nr:hypothetical protein [Bacteroides acidifaciens]MDE6821112.1 hypothetical protein [Bacteroides acidifaciens]
MKVEEPIGEYYSQSYIKNIRRRIIKSIREEENVDVLKQYMQLQKETEGQMNISRKKRRELFNSQSLIGSIDSEIPWEEMKDNIF